MGKLCEQVIVNKLKGSIQTIILSAQYAYWPKVGTADAILQLIDNLTLDINCPENKYTQMAYLDFSKFEQVITRSSRLSLENHEKVV